MPIAFEPLQTNFTTATAARAAAQAAGARRRIESSIGLAAIAIVMLTHVLMPASPQAAWSAWYAGPAAAPQEVRIVDTAPRLDVPCENQTWPYIHARCLTGAGAAATAPRIVSKSSSASDLDPRQATPPVVVLPPVRERGDADASARPPADFVPSIPREAVDAGVPSEAPKPRRNYFPKVTIQ